MDSRRLHDEIVAAGEVWADCDAAASLLEETKKTVLAKLMQEAEGSSTAAREMYALADPAYEKHIAGMVSARKAANKARVRYDSAKILAELQRTEESSRREEMRLGR